jgi:hypothetical protein
MSLISIPLAGGRLKVKRRSEMRRPEREREVWVLNFGLLIIAWWSGDSLERYRQDG